MTCTYPVDGPHHTTRECGRRAVIVFARDAEYARCHHHSGPIRRVYAAANGYRVIGLEASRVPA